MSKIVYINLPASGHINPTIGIIRELTARGYEVICINSDSARAKYASTDAEFVPYQMPSEFAERLLQSIAHSSNILDNALLLAEFGEQAAPFCVDLVREREPDFIMYDGLCHWAKQTGDLLALRCVVTSPLLALNFKVAGYTVPQIVQALLYVRRVMPLVNQVSQRVQKAGIVAPATFNSLFTNTGDLNLFFTSREFQPLPDLFPDTYRYVGPVIEPRPPVPDFPLAQVTDTDRPIVYISLGTLNNWNTDFYRSCFTAFAEYPALFVLSIGEHTDPRTLGVIPANFIVRGFVPQLEVLQRTEVFITHGGMNSVHEGLYYGVPLIIAPQQTEQSIVAKRARQLGTAVMLNNKPGSHVSAEQLRAALEKIAVHGLTADDNPYRVAARRIGDTLRTAGGARRAVDEVEAFVDSISANR